MTSNDASANNAGDALRPLERAVVDMLLAGDHPLLRSLRHQYEDATVRGRTFTGVGFWLDLYPRS